MVEKIKSLRAKLQSKALAQLCVFMHGEVNVIKAGADDYVATQVSKTINCYERRSIKPAVDIAHNFDWSSYIRPQRVCHAVHRCIGGNDIHGIASLHLNDCA